VSASVESSFSLLTAYLCEAGLSTLAMVKVRYRNKLQSEDDIRCALTITYSNFGELVKQD